MKKLGLIMSILATLSPAVTYAAGAAPALYGVKEVLIRPVSIASPQVSSDCGISSSDLLGALKADFQNINIPATVEGKIKPPDTGAARIEIVPEIISINEGLDCTTWVSLSAQTDNNVSIPPVDVLRSVTVSYWHQGSLVNSPQAVHEKSVNDAFANMVAAFGQEYRSEQKP